MHGKNRKDHRTPYGVGDDHHGKAVVPPVQGSPESTRHRSSTNEHEVKRPDMDTCINGRGSQPSLWAAKTVCQILLKIPPPVDLFTGAGNKEQQQRNNAGRGPHPFAVDTADLMTGKRKNGRGNYFAQPEHHTTEPQTKYP